jgi:hypothetical protein
LAKLQLHRRESVRDSGAPVRAVVLDGGAARRDGQLSRLQAFDLGLEVAIEVFPPLDQGARQLVQRLTRIREVDATSAALQEFHAQLALQGLQLQADRGLGQIKRFGSATERAQLHRGHESAHLLQAIALVVVAAGVAGGCARPCLPVSAWLRRAPFWPRLAFGQGLSWQ